MLIEHSSSPQVAELIGAKYTSVIVFDELFCIVSEPVVAGWCALGVESGGQAVSSKLVRKAATTNQL